jgi:uncharacterized membrane protein
LDALQLTVRALRLRCHAHNLDPAMSQLKMSQLDLVTLAAALGSGLAAGFFFAFSFTVMPALAKIPAAQGIAAMQSINIVVINPWFFTVFFGTALLSVIAIVAALMRWQDPRAIQWLVAGTIYLLGTIVVTMVCNVPRNNALAALAPESPAAATYWIEYLSSWTAWNHVRTIAPLVSAALFTWALRRGAAF